MKKILLILFISLSINVLGQEHFVGVQAGLNFTNISSKEVFDDAEMRTGFSGGINYELKTSGKFQYEINVLYSQRGFNERIILMNEYGVEMEIKDDFKFYYNYFSIPLKVGYELGNKMKIIPRVGIVPSFLSKAGIVAPQFDGNGNVTGHETTVHTDYVSRFDFGGLAELGFERELSGNMLLCAALDYKHSITTFSNSDYFDNSKMRHYGYSISIGVKYRIKTK